MNTFQKITAIASMFAMTAFYNGNFNESNTRLDSPNAVASSNTIQNTYEQKLRSANKIVVDETVLSFGKDYEIYADGVKVATLSGKDVNWWEDRFVLKTIDGKVIASEKENKRIATFNRSASFYDGQGNMTGYIAEELLKDLFSLNHIFHIYDSNQKEIGKTEKLALTFLDKIILYDMQKNTDYIIKEQLSAFGDKYVINVVDKKSVIPVEKAILLTCIEDAIKDAKEAESSDDD